LGQTIGEQRVPDREQTSFRNLVSWKKECDESAYWMEMILARKLLKRTRLSNLLAEANELLGITVKSIKTARRNRRR
jgi:four helix bundle protein